MYIHGLKHSTSQETQKTSRKRRERREREEKIHSYADHKGVDIHIEDHGIHGGKE